MRTDVCVVGGGPAGMMLAVLLLREGLTVTVLEKHADFLRDFRGDTIHASTLNLMDELGWADEFLRLPHQKIRRLSGVFGGETYTVADCTRLPGRHKYIALMPQWDFLDFLAAKAAEYPGFTLLRSTKVDGLLREGPAGRGRRCRRRRPGRDGSRCGPASRWPATGGTPMSAGCWGCAPEEFGAPMDVLWFRLPREPTDPEGLSFIVGTGVALVLIDRSDYFQIAYVIPKGGYEGCGPPASRPWSTRSASWRPPWPAGPTAPEVLGRRPHAHRRHRPPPPLARPRGPAHRRRRPRHVPHGRRRREPRRPGRRRRRPDPGPGTAAPPATPTPASDRGPRPAVPLPRAPNWPRSSAAAGSPPSPPSSSNAPWAEA